MHSIPLSFIVHLGPIATIAVGAIELGRMNDRRAEISIKITEKNKMSLTEKTGGLQVVTQELWQF